MIIRKNPDNFILINQHDHAHISGEMARHWQAAYFLSEERKESVLTAIYQHDRAWINPDAAPIWNDQVQAPYSFIDFPTALKVVHYQAGINQVATTDTYAALLNSLHYTTFPQLASSDFGQTFLATENKRQTALKDTLGLQTNAAAEILEFHLQLLKFCDNLSIYLCINEPGVKKAAEHPWFRAGIPDSENFTFTQGEKIQATWLSSTQVQVSPFPFAGAFTVSVPYKKLSAAGIAQHGLTAAFEGAQPATYEVTLLG